jgi:Flp pilus assembly protein TadD
MQMKKERMPSSQSSSETEKKPVKWERMAVAFAILFLVISGISSFFPAERLWGVNHLCYYPLWLRALIMLIGFAAFIPLVNRSLQGFLNKSVIPGFNFLAEKRKNLGYWIIILLFVLFFYLFRTRMHLLGDGAQILSNANSGTLSVKWTQPLAIRIYLLVYGFLNKFSRFDAAAVYALISYVCGTVFIFFALRFADLLGKSVSTKLFVFLALSFMGGTELFLGYAEHYPLFYCGILMYLFYSLKCLKGESKLFSPFLILLILLPMHFFSLYLLPSAIFLLVSAGGEGKTSAVLKTKRIWIVSPVLIVIFASLVIYFWKYGWYSLGYFVPIFSGSYYAPDHTLFSLPHLLDLLNQQLLISPIGFLLLLIFLISRPKGMDSKDKEFQFLLIVSISQLFFNFVLDPGLGAARDWDLFAGVGIGYTVMALWIFSKMLLHPKTNYLKLGLTIIVLVSTLPWIGINASADRSIRRFRNLLDLDPRKSLSGHYILARHFESSGELEEMDREDRMVLQKCPEASMVAGGLKSLKKGDLEKACLKFRQALQIAPDFPEARCALGEYYIHTRDLRNAEVELMRALDLRPGYAKAYLNLGIMYGLRKDIEKARKMLERALIVGGENVEVYHNLGNIYLASQDLDKAILAYQKAIRANDESMEPHFGLALAFFRQDKLQESLKEFNRALEINPDFAPALYQLGKIYRRLGMKKESISALKKYLELERNGSLAENARQLIEEIKNE